MTWKEVKKQIEELGVRDNDEINWIDFSQFGRIDGKKEEDGSWNIFQRSKKYGKFWNTKNGKIQYAKIANFSM